MNEDHESFEWTPTELREVTRLFADFYGVQISWMYDTVNDVYAARVDPDITAISKEGPKEAIADAFLRWAQAQRPAPARPIQRPPQEEEVELEVPAEPNTATPPPAPAPAPKQGPKQGPKRST